MDERANQLDICPRIPVTLTKCGGVLDCPLTKFEAIYTDYVKADGDWEHVCA
jgi:hypothetical protein